MWKFCRKKMGIVEVADANFLKVLRIGDLTLQELYDRFSGRCAQAACGGGEARSLGKKRRYEKSPQGSAAANFQLFRLHGLCRDHRLPEAGASHFCEM